jgi:hypothetical protein
MTKPVPNPAKPRLTTSAMIASIASEGQRTQAAPFGTALVELAKTRPDIIGMTADLGKYTDLHLFGQAYPDRYYQMGMAEQLLFGAASGRPWSGPVCSPSAGATLTTAVIRGSRAAAMSASPPPWLAPTLITALWFQSGREVM